MKFKIAILGIILSLACFLKLGFSQGLQTKLSHLYITVSKVEISKDAGKTWVVVFTGNRTHDLVALNGKNVKAFGNTLAFGKYNKARTTVISGKAELILSDGMHPEKIIALDNPALINMEYPIIDVRDIGVNIEVDTVEKDVRLTSKFYFDAEKSYSLKAVWDPKENNYKITEIKFQPVITVK